MPDIWSRLDDKIYEWRWFLASALVGLALISGGTFFLLHGETILSNKPTPTTSTSSDPLPDTRAPVVTGPVNINTASQVALETLPGIGPTLAQRIIDYRSSQGPFKKIEDLMKVKGIGPKTFAELKDKISLE